MFGRQSRPLIGLEFSLLIDGGIGFPRLNRTGSVSAMGAAFCSASCCAPGAPELLQEALDLGADPEALAPWRSPPLGLGDDKWLMIRMTWMLLIFDVADQ